MRARGQLLVAFRSLLPAPEDAGPSPRTYVRVRPLEGLNATKSVIEAAPGNGIVARLRLQRETVVSAMISRDVLGRLKDHDEAILTVNSRKRVAELETDIFEADLERDDGQGTVGESFPDVAENFDKLANPNSKAVVTFRTSQLADVLKVANALGVDRLAFRLPKTVGAPLFLSGDVAEDLLAVGEASGMDEAGIFEALVSQVDPFGDKEEKPSKTPQTKLPFDAGPSEATPADTVADPATPAEPEAPARARREWKPSDDIVGLSLHRPWAGALVLGLKEFETRSWDAKFGGGPWRSWVAIAASKEEPEDSPPSLQRLVRETATARGLWKDLEPAGAIVGIAFLDASFPTTGDDAPKIDRAERARGDWSEGRFAFRFSDVFVLAQPVPVVGRQRLYRLDDDVRAALERVDLVRVR